MQRYPSLKAMGSSKRKKEEMEDEELEGPSKKRRTEVNASGPSIDPDPATEPPNGM